MIPALLPHAPMYLIQILLPLRDNDKQALPLDLYHDVKTELTEEFGGLTAFTRSPAEGLWKEIHHETVYDEVIIFEVMAAGVDRIWWRRYRHQLETRFRQEAIVIRAQQITLL